MATRTEKSIQNDFESERDKTRSEHKKQSFSIFVDSNANVNESEKHKKVPIKKPPNPEVLAESSVNHGLAKHPQMHQAAKKKKKKNLWSKNKSKKKLPMNQKKQNAFPAEVTNNFNQNQHRYESYQDANMEGTFLQSRGGFNAGGVQYAKSRFDTQTPYWEEEHFAIHANMRSTSKQQHLYAADGNRKELFECGQSNDWDYDPRIAVTNNHYGYYRSIGANPASFHNSPSLWIDMVDCNTQIEAIVVNNGGNSKLVAIPPPVGATILREVMLQKENLRSQEQNNPPCVEMFPTHAIPYLHHGHDYFPQYQSFQTLSSGIYTGFPPIQTPFAMNMNRSVPFPQSHVGYDTSGIPHTGHYSMPYQPCPPPSHTMQQSQPPPPHADESTLACTPHMGKCSAADDEGKNLDSPKQQDHNGRFEPIIEQGSHNHLHPPDRGDDPNGRTPYRNGADAEAPNIGEMIFVNRNAVTPHRGDENENMIPARRVSFSPNLSLPSTPSLSYADTGVIIAPSSSTHYALRDNESLKNESHSI